MRIKHNKFSLLPVFVVMMFRGLSHAEVPVLEITLDEAVKVSLDNSHNLKAQKLVSQSQEAKGQSIGARRYPSLSVEGSFTYLSNVGEIDAGPGGKIRLGDNYVYSVGPAVNWIVWDWGKISKSADSIKILSRAYLKDYEAARRQTVLDAKASYYKVQLGSEQLKLVADSLRLSLSRYEDISKRFNAGSSSRLDLLSSHQEVIDFKKTFETAQNDLASSIRELLALMGKSQDGDFSFPSSSEILDAEKLADQKPNIIIRVEKIDETVARTFAKGFAQVDVNSHPLIASADYKIQSARYSAKSSQAQHYPSLNLQAKTSLEYPNTPVLEKYSQNRVGLFLNIPLFEWGRVNKEVLSAKLIEQANEEQKKLLEINLEKIWHASLDSIGNLQSQAALNKTAVKETQELAELVYKSYLAGRSNHLEVQRANLKALQAKVESARTNTQLLIEMAKLASLSSEEI